MIPLNEVINEVVRWATIVSTVGGAIVLLYKLLKKLNDKRNKEIVAAVSELRESVQDRFEKIDKRLDSIDAKNDENERDRLKDEIFRCGNYARKGAHISSEEFRNVQRNYEKYHNLGGNSIAHDEYLFICNYYNNKGWEKNE